MTPEDETEAIERAHQQRMPPEPAHVCDWCGETKYLAGDIWPHADGRLMCEDD